MNQIPLAVQMYTLRDECERDFLKTLHKVAEIGFNGVEFAGYYDTDPAVIKKTLDDLDLKAAGSHFVLKEMEENLEQCIEAQQVLGSRHLAIAYPYDRMEKEEEYHRLAEKLNGMGEKVNAAGLTLSYHHHEFELASFGEWTGLEIVLKETNPEWVQAELDIYWLAFAGKDPAEWISTYQDRVSLIHMKDMESGEGRSFEELGKGVINLSSVGDAAVKANAEWLIVEQDECKRPPFESISSSLSYLKGLSLKV
ncbi:TIM barrel protein [Bacillus mangrovi]|uniref:TIM barrel protein n=1 Tax=Metabacillus mangrovi TaxID=1491830 RepID=A0A7X2S7P0_9BACI|nr:sugar phosphate isomerase/epimerase [Metabacillus mangrovi]MTH54788.1 TIM barrel protein [Metabacillus mangrovi]